MERPVTVRGSRFTPSAWTALGAGVVAAGLWTACSPEVFGAARFTQVWTSGLLLVVGALTVYLAVGTLRTRVEVFPDRLESTRGLRRTQVIGPGELVTFRASGKGNTVISAATARRRGFSTNRFHHHHDALVDWLDRNTGEEWTAFREFFGKLTVQQHRAPLRESLSTLLIVGVFLATLLTFPGLFIGNAYDAAHREQVTCTVTAAEAITVSSRSTRGIGSSRAGVGVETSDCGRLTMTRGVTSDDRDGIARELNRTKGPHVFTVGGGSFWLRKNTPITVPSPTVYSIDDLSAR
ncbi:hypothetical protein NS184_14530 [Curtobacterium luteum]|uniref:Uncharacterized protein n=1 Tax=Curtobacterium luteum TaxID=33881 RepID=A0A175RHL8_9MICO|nr:hypothetical protein NS184_14530 [Curtobacterium luteum]